VLAGYPADTDRFLRSNPGLASRFSTRIEFPSYSPEDLADITALLAEQAGDSFDREALVVLDEIFSHAGSMERRINELGNGRFARSLFERACGHRDVRVVRLGEAATAEDLTTVTANDLRAAYRELAGSNATGFSPVPTSQPADVDPAGAVRGSPAVDDEAEAWLRPRPAAEREAEAG
jgi:hypothetical protein